MRFQLPSLRRSLCRMTMVSLTAIVCAPIVFAHAQSSAASTKDSVPALMLDRVQQLLAATKALDRASQEHPQIQLPNFGLSFMDPLAWERALRGHPSLTTILRNHGFSPRAYSRELTRLATAVVGVEAQDAQDPKTSWVTGTQLWIRLRPKPDDTTATPSSGWIKIRARDAEFVRQHQSIFATETLWRSTIDSVKRAPGRTIQAWRFATGEGHFLDSTDAPLAANGDSATSGPPLRVLFIGDGGRGDPAEYHHNEAYRLFRIIAAAGLRRRVVVGQVTVAAANLGLLWPLTSPQLTIRGLPWDYVVPVEHPFFVKDSAKVSAAASLFSQTIHATPARMVYPVYRDKPGVEELMTAVGRRANAILAPMGLAWGAALAADSLIHLPSGGAGHSGPMGMYLQALVYYRAITGRSPIGLPAPTVETGPDTRVDIRPRDVALLQRAAAAAFVK